MFGFFNKWKRAGRGVGISGGVGKLAAFDKDGNVVSAGVSVDDVTTSLYQHNIHWTASDDSDTTFDLYCTIISSASTAFTAQTFHSVLPAHDKNPIMANGWTTTPLFTSSQFATYAIGKASDVNKIAIYPNMEGVVTEVSVTMTFGTFTDTVSSIS